MSSEELVTGAEIGRRLGVTRECVSQWATTERYGFPAAVARIGASKVWRWGDVQAWFEEYRKTPRRPGRPRGGGEDKGGRA